MEKLAAQTYTRRSASLLSSDSPTEHRKPSEKPAAAFFNWKDGLCLCRLVGMLPSTPSLTLHAALASDCLEGCHKSPPDGTTGQEPHQWLSQSCPNPLRTHRITQHQPNHCAPKLLPALPQTLCLLRGHTSAGTPVQGDLAPEPSPACYSSCQQAHELLPPTQSLGSASQHSEPLWAQHCMHGPDTILLCARLLLPILPVPAKPSPPTPKPKLQSQGAAVGRAHPVLSPTQAGTSRLVWECTSQHMETPGHRII